jgi:hypothetical protein
MTRFYDLAFGMIDVTVIEIVTIDPIHRRELLRRNYPSSVSLQAIVKSKGVNYINWTYHLRVNGLINSVPISYWPEVAAQVGKYISLYSGYEPQCNLSITYAEPDDTCRIEYPYKLHLHIFDTPVGILSEDTNYTSFTVEIDGSGFDITDCVVSYLDELFLFK